MSRALRIERLAGSGTTSGGTQNPEQLGHCNADAPLLARTPSTGTSNCEAHLGQWASIRPILAHEVAALGQTTLAYPATKA